jgi:hypothetical protein
MTATDKGGDGVLKLAHALGKGLEDIQTLKVDFKTISQVIQEWVFSAGDNDDWVDDNGDDNDWGDDNGDDDDWDDDNDDDDDWNDDKGENAFKSMSNPDDELKDGDGNRIPLISSRKNTNSAKKMLKYLSKLVEKLREV